MKARLDCFAKAPEIMKAVIALNRAVEASGIEHSLMHLVKIRASQINGCTYCLDMHNHEALADGEDPRRLFLVAAWRETPLFSERERAAFEWTEAVTQISHGGVSDALYARTRGQFSDEELVKLTAIIAMINVWNRFSVSFHTIHPEHREAIRHPTGKGE